MPRPVRESLGSSRWLSLCLVAVLLGCSAVQHHDGSPSSAPSPRYDPQMYAQMRAYGFVWTDRRYPVEKDGRPRIFRVADLGKPGSSKVDAAIVDQVRKVVRQVREPYRRHLSYLFADEYYKRYLVVLIDGYPQYPVVNLCYSKPGCAHACPRYLDPNLRIVRVTTMPDCADSLPIWTYSG